MYANSNLVWLFNVSDINYGFKTHLFLGLDDGNVVGKRSLGPSLARWIVRQHDLDLDTQDTLTEKDVSDGGVDVLFRGIATVNHQSVHKLHSLGTLTAKFT